MDVLHWLSHNHDLTVQNINGAIIPMVLIPLTAVTVLLTSIAGIIAGWFGIKLNTEGPKQFLEVLLKKKVLLSMLLLNLCGFGIYKGYKFVKTLPSFPITIKYYSNKMAVPTNETYSDSLTRNYKFIGKLNPSFLNKISLEKEIKLPKGAFRSGVISGNSIFYGVDDGYVYEIDKSSLSVKRKLFIGTQVTTRPIILNNMLYTGEGNHYTHHARIYSYNLKSGEFFKSFSTTGHTEGQPNIGVFNGKNILFATAGVGGLYAIDPITMKEIWHKYDGHLDATVSIDKNTVYAGTGVEKGAVRERSYATAYDALTGKTIWKKELPISNWMHPVVTKDDVCYVLGEIYFPSEVGMLYCLNKITGNPHFAIPFNGPIASKPFYVKGENPDEEYIFIAGFSGEVCGISLIKKEKMWCYNTGKKDTNYALSSFDYDNIHGILWYPSLDNGLYGVEVKTGKIISHWLPGVNDSKWKASYAAVTIENNSIYLLDIKGNLRKFKIE